jgi:hypothetical protein
MTGASFLPPMIAIIIIAKIRKVIRRFKETGSTSPQTAKTLEELNVDYRFAFRKMLKREIIIEASPNRYYLNEENLAGYNNTRRMIMLVVILLLALVIIADTFFWHY